MSKKVEEFIALHNHILNTGVKESLYLEHKIKTCCRQAAQHSPFMDSLNLKFFRLITVYTFLFFILVFSNFFLIKILKNKVGNANKAGPEIAIFMPAVPGSIASAYAEVSLWEK